MNFKSAFAAIILLAQVLFANGVLLGNTLAITDPNFQSPTALPSPGYAYPLTFWASGTVGTGDGTFFEANYGLNGGGASNDPHGFLQAAYINDSISQQVGTLVSGAQYTINFYTSTDGGGADTVVKLVDGSPSGTVLATSGVYTGTKNVWTLNSTVLTAVGGSTGDALYLEFAHTAGSQTFLTGVSGTSNVPEPSSVILCGLGAVGLLVAARRRRRKV